MAGQTRMIVQDSQQLRFCPFPLRAENLARALVEIQMPEPIDVGNLVAPYFTSFQPGLGSLGTRARLSANHFAYPAVLFHVTHDRGVGRHASVARLGGNDN